MLLNVSSPSVLAIGAHPDDIELGAGGLIYRLIEERKAFVKYLILTPGLKGTPREKSYSPESRRAEAKGAAAVLKVAEENVTVWDYEDCGMHTAGHKLIQDIELCVHEYSDGWDLILTHSGEDTHADHREAHEATISALRYYYGTVLLYQSPSTKPNGFHPNFFVSLDEEAIHHKFTALHKHDSQRSRKYMKIEHVKAMAARWSFFHRAPSSYFEAFEVYKSFWMSPNRPSHPSASP